MEKPERVRLSLTMDKDFHDIIKSRIREEGFKTLQEFVLFTARREAEKMGWLTRHRFIMVEKEVADELIEMAKARGMDVPNLVSKIVENWMKRKDVKRNEG